MGDNLVQGLLPYDRVWAISPDWKRHFASVSRELYAALRGDPKRFAELSRSGCKTPEPAFALGVNGVARQGRGRVRRAAKPEYSAENPAPLSAVNPVPSAYVDDDDYYDDEDSDPKPARYAIVNGVALLSVSGPMTKKPTSAMWLLGGTSTIFFREDLAHASANPNVGAILIDFDTPGGTVAGTADLADHIAKVAQSKIVEAFVPDLCASAGYWAMSGVRRITVGRAALVGSIGVYMVVEDLSKMYEEAGVQVFVFRAGQFKAAGEEGTALSVPEQEEFQREVNELNYEFAYVSVKNGRRLTDEQVAAVNTGQVWKGQQLIQLGLADAVGTYQDVLERLAREVAAGGLAKVDDVLPGGSNDGTTSATLRKMSARAGSVEEAAVLLSVAQRIEAERPSGILEAEAAGRRAGGAGASVSETPEPAPEPGTNPDVPVPENVAQTDTETPETTPEATPQTTDDTGTEESPVPAGTASDGNPDAPTPPDAAGDTTTKEETGMAGTENNTPNAAATLDPALIAALVGASVTTVAQFNGLLGLASDGKKARAAIIGSIGAYTTRLEGAEATDGEGTDGGGVDFTEIYGQHPFDSLVKIEARLKKSYEAAMKHPGQGDENGNLPMGARATTPTAIGNVSPAVLAAIAQGPQGGPNAADPTGTGVPVVDPDAIAARFNKNRDASVAKQLGK